MTLDIRDLVGTPRRDLAALAARGDRFDPAALAGWTYDGISLGLPRVIERLTWTKFAKAFARDDGGALRGWNIRIEQDALDRPWVPRRRRGVPITFGHFAVATRAGRVELDYGWIRDPLVALAGPDILLGTTYVVAGPLAIPTPSWFVLRRGEPIVT
jgi:hypothetical protein